MQSTPARRSRLTSAIAVVASVLGALTLKEGGAVLFGDGTARAAAGHYVPFVVWFNFLAGFAYIVVGVALWLQRHWAVWLVFGILAATVVVFAAFGVHVFTGGAYEMRTVGAMVFRTLVWAVIAVLSWRVAAGRSGAGR